MDKFKLYSFLISFFFFVLVCISKFKYVGNGGFRLVVCDE